MTENNQNSCSNYKLPCFKFIISAGLSVGVFVFGCVSLATGGVTAPLAPLYSSMITGALSIWVPTPEYGNNNIIQIDNKHDISTPVNDVKNINTGTSVV